MPTTTERIEPGIYLANWIDHVSIEDVFAAGAGISALAKEDGVSRFITVIDASVVKTIPFDLRMLTKTVDPRTIAILALNAPIAGEIMGRMFNSMMPIKAEFFRDYDLLMERAHELLAAETEEHSQPETNP